MEQPSALNDSLDRAKESLNNISDAHRTRWDEKADELRKFNSNIPMSHRTVSYALTTNATEQRRDEVAAYDSTTAFMSQATEVTEASLESIVTSSQLLVKVLGELSTIHPFMRGALFYTNV
jgi:hypothetical protein